MESLKGYSLLDALRQRRSRRFAIGLTLPREPLGYTSRQAALPLTMDEEALLAFAACGITGYALGDVAFGGDQGGTIFSGFLGQTIAAGDAIHSVSVVVTNDRETYLLRRPQDFPSADLPVLIRQGQDGAFANLFQQSRVKIKDGRSVLPNEPIFNLNVNRWAINAAGSTYFLPVGDLTLMYINALLEVFNEATGAFIVDERAGFGRPAAGRFARSKGGHLYDNPRLNRSGTIQRLELLAAEMVAVEQGMILQNLGLMTQAVGLGGFPNFAEHDYAWLRAVGARMSQVPTSKYLHVGMLPGLALRLLGRDDPTPYPLGIESNGQVLVQPFCPPYYPTMAAAVQAVVDKKTGPRGTFREGIGASAWLHPTDVASGIPSISERAIATTVAYCEYVYGRYGRFPAYLPPLHTTVGYQAHHLDLDFYGRYYRPEALSDTQRVHLDRWHPKA